MPNRPWVQIDGVTAEFDPWEGGAQGQDYPGELVEPEGEDPYFRLSPSANDGHHRIKFTYKYAGTDDETTRYHSVLAGVSFNGVLWYYTEQESQNQPGEAQYNPYRSTTKVSASLTQKPTHVEVDNNNEIWLQAYLYQTTAGSGVGWGTVAAEHLIKVKFEMAPEPPGGGGGGA